MVPAERLLGRAAVLAAAAPVVEDALAGAGQFLMVSGDAGIGKTAVLGTLIGQAGPEALVLQATCWEGDGTPPYWPWSQVLRATGLAVTELGEAGWLLDATAGPATSSMVTAQQLPLAALGPADVEAMVAVIAGAAVAA